MFDFKYTNPRELRYSKEHEWVKLQSDGTALVGITHYAQAQLGDIVYLDLPKPRSKVEQFKKLGEVESVKAVSDIYSPISGEVLALNKDAMDHPELVNQDPYGKGWLLHLRPGNPAELQTLLSAAAYDQLIKGQEH